MCFSLNLIATLSNCCYKSAIIALLELIMTVYELRLWRKRMAWDQERAAEELEKCLRSYKIYEKSHEIDPVVELTTRALTLKSLLSTLSEKKSAEIYRVLSTLAD